jgi:hypothetical protein
LSEIYEEQRRRRCGESREVGKTDNNSKDII